MTHENVRRSERLPAEGCLTLAALLAGGIDPTSHGSVSMSWDQLTTGQGEKEFGIHAVVATGTEATTS
jgi:hypothetical protein